LVRAMRARTDGSPVERTPTHAEATVSRPRAPVSVPDAGATGSDRRGTELPLPGSSLPPALPQVVRRAAPEQLPESERAPRMRRERKHGPAASLPARHSDRPTAVRRVIARGDLRRAVVLIAVLGPCRALESKDASQLGY
jgi:hypothetical protein